MFNEIRGVKEVKAFLKTLPKGSIQTALPAFSKYIIGNKERGLRHDEPQKYVSRRKAGYTTSQKQMRYFFAVGILENTGNGIRLNRYVRTGETAAAWDWKMRDAWHYTIVNPKPGAYWTRDENGQTRQHAMAGRRKVTQVIADNMKGSIRSALAAVNKWLNGKRKK